MFILRFSCSSAVGELALLSGTENIEVESSGLDVHNNSVKCLLGFRSAVTFSALMLVLPAVCPAPEGHRFVAPPSAQRSAPTIVVGPELEPQPPCGKEPSPPYPGLDDAAVVKSWSESEFGYDWRPPGCTGWTGAGFTTLITTVARFRYVSGPENLLRRVGAISELAGMRYWSTTHKRWRTLVVDAYALTNSQPGQHRKDFTPEEMKEGDVLYFEQVDNLSGKGVYRMRVVEASAGRIVIDVENATTIRYLLIPILRPGEIQSIYFLDRESNDVWRFYSMVRTGRKANRLIAGNASSAVNRAAAFYRHFAGIPADQEPPAAR